MGKFIAFGSVIVFGIIIADFLIHPTGTQAAGNAISSVEVPAVNGLLGTTTKS